MPSRPSSDNSNYALKRIRALLEPAMLGPDRRLPTERALCDLLEVSRRSVRRALEVLEAEGRIWRRQGAGTFVGPAPGLSLVGLENIAKQSSYLEVMEVRLQIEPELAALAARRAKPGDIKRLQTLLAHLGRSHDADERELWDSSLHRTIAEIAGNPLYLAIFDLIDRVRQDGAWVELRERARSTEALRLYRLQHDAIVGAIAAGNAAAAHAAMAAHLQALQANLARSAQAEAADAV